MNGGHDLGGVDGLGHVVVERDEPVFHSDWERAAFAMFSMPFRAGFFGVDQFRFGIEHMHPADYLSSRYYEHWLATVEYHGKRTGKLDLDEVERRTQYFLDHPDEPLPETHDPELVSFVETAVKQGVTASRPSDKKAKFSVGDRVRVIDSSPFGHTRKARYIRGKTGEIVMSHGQMVYPDSAGNDGPEDPQHVYTVRFDAKELWGDEAAEPNASVTFDVWEPYIEKA
jgi:nitrile hydratase